jgi:hypothetical protein
VKSARLTLRSGQNERTLVDQRHPFEFSAPAGDAATVEYHLEFERTDGTVVDAGRHSLER